MSRGRGSGDRLNADPYGPKARNGKTQGAQEYYWGGYNTITGGKDGMGGKDGWYYFKF